MRGLGFFNCAVTSIVFTSLACAQQPSVAITVDDLPYVVPTANVADGPSAVEKIGSAQESVEARILGCFPEDNKFGLGGRHPLRFQQEVTAVLIAPAAP